MQCPKCGAPSLVLDTRALRNGVTKRNRKCHNNHRFSTYEVAEQLFNRIRKVDFEKFERGRKKLWAAFMERFSIYRDFIAGSTTTQLGEKYNRHPRNIKRIISRVRKERNTT